MKKIVSLLLLLCLSLSLVSCKAETLPAPELEEGMRGQLGIDKNINEKTIDKYLNREDSVYRDMRMLVDEADYEAIGGDSYLSGFVKGFEVVPYPYLCNVEGLPAEVGSSYEGTTLFTKDENGEYIANYKESMHILESLFPKDKYIFLMCGGGGYAGMTKDLLVKLGWDGNKIYNTGGYWYYQGENKVETKYEENGEELYDFSLVHYHPIDFDSLHLINDAKPEEKEKTEVLPSEDDFLFIHNSEELKALEEEGKTFLLYVYLPGCSSCASFLPIVKEFKKANEIDMYAVALSDIFKESNSVSDRVSYTPSIFIYKDGEVLAYLDPASDADLPYYQTLEGLSGWVGQYLDVKTISSDYTSDISDCDSACSITD